MPTSQEIALGLKRLSRIKRRLIVVLGALFIVAVLGIGWSLNDRFSVVVPASGGALREGLVGTPLFVNPVLAASDADRDLTALVYSGLMRSVGDELIPDLAESYQVSDDQLTYTFILKDGLTWQDGEPLTAADVEFTVGKTQDPLAKSPRRASWEGVAVTVAGPREIQFQLKKPYPSFLEITTMGILPKHLWNNFTAETFSLNQLNTDGVGSGPYRVKAIKKDGATGLPKYYQLAPFADFALGAAPIANLRLYFYPNEGALVKAFENGEIDALSAIATERAAALAAQGARVLTTPLPRVFAVFFNQNKQPLFLDAKVRAALDIALDRETIIESTLYGYGTPLYGPLPPSEISPTASGTPRLTAENRLAEARRLLEEGGWEWRADANEWRREAAGGDRTLAFAIATSDVPELKATAELIRDTWTALGAKVELKIYEIGDLNRDIIRPRDYEALFFGEVLGRTPDLYSFWHSTQRLDPGNNIAVYANADVDAWLEKLRSSADREEAAELYSRIDAEIRADQPAVFVYAPDFIYLLPERVRGVDLQSVNLPAERFWDIHHWHIATDKVWKIFAK